MSVLEAYETAESLRLLKPNEPLLSNVVRCLITGTIPTRPREFRDGVVFTAIGVLRVLAKSDSATTAVGNTVKINFYDEWARGASFMEKGDVIILKGFTIVAAPQLPAAAVSADAGSTENFLVALQRQSSLRVLQPEELGDTMEVTVTPDSFESPCVRVLPRLDHINRVFINDVKKKQKVPAATAT